MTLELLEDLLNETCKEHVDLIGWALDSEIFEQNLGSVELDSLVDHVFLLWVGDHWGSP